MCLKMSKYGFSALGRGFLYALRGFCHCVKTKRNLRIHLVAAFHVFLLSPFYHFTKGEYGVLCLACGLVISAEMVNTALEEFCDGQYPGYSPVAKRVKDVAAGAVLLCALAAAGVGVIFFWDMEAFGRMAQFITLYPWSPVIPVATLAAGIIWAMSTKKKEPMKEKESKER